MRRARTDLNQVSHNPRTYSARHQGTGDLKKGASLQAGIQGGVDFGTAYVQGSIGVGPTAGGALMATKSPGELSGEARLALGIDAKVKGGFRKQKPSLSASADVYHGTSKPPRRDTFDGTEASRYGAAVHLGLHAAPPGQARGDYGVANATLMLGNSSRQQPVHFVPPPRPEPLAPTTSQDPSDTAARGQRS